MFPPTSTNTPDRTALRTALRRLADRVVAFTTLESYASLDDLRPGRDELKGPRDAHGIPARHPHRIPLARASTARVRQGAVPARHQHCVSPLTGPTRRRIPAHTR